MTMSLIGRVGITDAAAFSCARVIPVLSAMFLLVTAHPGIASAAGRAVSVTVRSGEVSIDVRSISYADPAVAAFVVIPVLLVVVLVWGTAVAWRTGGASPAAAQKAALLVAVAAIVWMAATWVGAQAGVLRDWDRTPPPFAYLVLSIVVLSVALAFGGLGRRLATFVPLSALVLVQGFRLPLELAMHAMYERGIMPREMSYAGRNFDIVTGAAAVVVGALLLSGRGGRRLAAAWNLMGLALLVNVVTVAILGTPRFRYFGDESLNVWVTYPPFVWLPAVMVVAALAGHLIVFRALRLQRAAVGNG